MAYISMTMDYSQLGSELVRDKEFAELLDAVADALPEKSADFIVATARLMGTDDFTDATRKLIRRLAEIEVATR